MGGLNVIVTRTLSTLIVLSIIGYALFVGRDYFGGPHVTLIPYPPRATHEGALTVQGTVRDVQDLTLNGAQVFYTSEQTFTERRILIPGENNFIIRARDMFNHTETTEFSVYYSPPEAVPLPQLENSLPATAPQSLN